MEQRFEFSHRVGPKVFCNSETGKILEASLIVSDNFSSEEEIRQICERRNSFYIHSEGFFYVFSAEEAK